jgi:hypothetical protein
VRGSLKKYNSFFSTLFVFRSCASSLYRTWECLLREAEADSVVHSDVAGVLSRAVSRPLLEKTFHMKIQSRKVFTHRESYETILAKTEELLVKVNQTEIHWCAAADISPITMVYRVVVNYYFHINCTVRGRVHLRHDLRFDLRFGACVIMSAQGNALS